MYHLHARYITKTTGALAVGTLQYVARTGRYKNRGDKVREVICFHMPDWENDVHGTTYWQASDSLKNRANARMAHLLEFSIPKALPVQSQRELVVRFAMEVSAMSAHGHMPHGVVPITLGIHEGFGRNPHVHMLIATSIIDGVPRPQARFFMRYNAKTPNAGGAKRSRVMAKKEWLNGVRELWARLANESLIAHGLPGTLDNRSNAERGILSEPSIHLGPSAAHLLKRGRPAPRVRKHSTIKAKNDDLLELQMRIKSRRQRLQELEFEMQTELDVFQVWLRRDRDFWNRLLKNHPLGGLFESLQAVSTAVAFESDLSNSVLVQNAAKSDAVMMSVVDSSRDVWDAVTTGQGIWLLRPNSDQTILVGDGYVATDCTDDVGLRAFVAAASRLPFTAPMIGANSSVSGSIQSCALELGLNWPIRNRLVRGASSKVKPK